MKVSLSWLVVWRPSADVTAQWDAARRHAKDLFWVLEWQKVGTTKQNLLRSEDFWMVADEVVIGFAIHDWFRGTWKCGAKQRTCEGLDGLCGENAVWWAQMHIWEEWANIRQQKEKRTCDTPGPTPRQRRTSGPPGQPGLSGQPEPLTPYSCILTPRVDPTSMADPTPGICPPIIGSPPVCPLPVCPPPVADTLGGLFCGGCRVCIIRTNRQTGWHKVGWSGTTVQCMSPTVSDTAMMTNILSRLWISSGHMGLFGSRSCRMWVYWGGLVQGTLG